MDLDLLKIKVTKIYGTSLCMLSF